MKLKNIYKKTLAMELIRMGHDLRKTVRNHFNPKYHIFVFPDTPALRRDLAALNNQEFIEEEVEIVE